MPVMNMFPGGSTLQIPLDAPTAFSATAGNAQVELAWTDPLDKYATPEGEVSETGDQLVSEWGHTVLVRKTGSQPAGPNDGTVVVSSSVRNQYQSTAYVDSGLTNDTTYYYGVFAYNKDGVASSGAFVNATPKSYAPVLNDNSWEQIQAAAAAGVAPSLWTVGDCKEIILDGTVRELSLSNYSVCVFILGFNHNAALEGNDTIHFQLGKTALSGETPICFISGEASDSDFYMNQTNRNSGGWKSAYMRTSIIGTNVTSYNNRFIGVLPPDLRAVLKAVQKYTNNTGESSAQNAITATTDYMFLLSELEVTGGTTYANSYEANYQKQYAYYASGNSKRFYKHDNPSTAAIWWLRSPYCLNSAEFCDIGISGYSSYTRARTSLGVTLAFVVG